MKGVVQFSHRGWCFAVSFHARADPLLDGCASVGHIHYKMVLGRACEVLACRVWLMESATR